MTVKMKSTTQTVSMKYEKTWIYFWTIPLVNILYQGHFPAALGTLYLPVTRNPTPGSTSTLSSAACDTEGGETAC